MVRATAVCILAAAAAACGSSTPGGEGDGGLDSGTAVDGGSGGGDAPAGGGLSFELVPTPPLTEVTPDVHVDELRIELRDVRAIGDSAPGDGHTSVASLSLEFRPDDEPLRLAFPLAPPGIYSSFEARFAGSHGNAFEIRGRVSLAGGETRFRIENDESSGAIGVDLQGLTVATQPRTAVIAVSLGFLAQVHWNEVEVDDGELRIESGDPQMAAIEAGLAAAFSLAGTR